MLTKHIGHTMMTKRSLLERSMFVRLLAVVLCLGSASTACAGTLTTWTGASGTNWGTNTNWRPTTTINTTGTFSLVFTGSGATGATGSNSVNNVGTVNVDSLNFTNNSTSTGRSFRIVSGTMNMASGTITTTTMTSGTLSELISSPLSLSGSNFINLGNNHNLTLSTVTGNGSIFKTGAGTLTLTSTASLSGLNVNQGSLQVGNSSLPSLNGLSVRVGSGTSSATIAMNSTITGGTTTASFIVGGTATFQANAGPNVTFSNSNFNVADSSITTPSVIQLNSSGALGTQTIAGTIQNNSATGLVNVRVGGGVWVLNGGSTYTGTTGVAAAGTLLMNGSTGTSTVTSAGYLGGSGTFGGLVSITGGTLSPGGTSSGGTITQGIGKMTVGSLTLGGSTSTATTMMQITGSNSGQFDQIVGSGSIQYGGTLALSLTGSYAPLTSFQLFSGFASRPGDFGAITLSASGTPYAGLTFTSFNDGNNWSTGWQNNQKIIFSEATGTLTIVPEPSTIVFAGMGIAVFGASTWWRRRRKNAPQLVKLVAR